MAEAPHVVARGDGPVIRRRVPLGPVRDQHGSEHEARAGQQGRRPPTARPGHDHHEPDHDDGVGELHDGPESEGEPGEGDRHVREPLAHEQGGGAYDERRRERLRVKVQPGVDIPRAVVPALRADDEPRHERPDREEPGRQHPDGPAAARPVAEEPRRNDREADRDE